MQVSTNLPDRNVEYSDDYAEAWEEWAASGEAEAWASTVSDGLD